MIISNDILLSKGAEIVCFNTDEKIFEEGSIALNYYQILAGL